MTFSEKAALERAIDEITGLALSMGYDPYPIHFEVVPDHIIYELGSYALPARFSHWTFGRDYHRQKTSYEHGLSRIYEIVFNTDPCQAFLLDVNSLTSHKLTIAHVIGHCHFFKHNSYFQHTDRRMIERVRLHRDRLAAYEDEFGWRTVESFLDAALCLEWHVDPLSTLVSGEATQRAPGARAGGEFDDLLSMNVEPQTNTPTKRKIPARPERDLLGFLAKHARDLEDWQRDILGMIRAEMLYFLPQVRTKILNEGFASVAHERILEDYLTAPEDIWEFRRLHAGVLSPSPNPGSLNPYHIGFQVLKDIERRYDGDVLPGADAETDWIGRTQPRGRKGDGWRKIFEVAQEDSDASFLRRYLTQELVARLDLFSFGKVDDESGKAWVVQSTKWERVRDALCESLANAGIPVVTVEDGDFERRGELLLKHHHDGRDLEADWAKKTLDAVALIWGRPVHLETIAENQPARISRPE